MPARSAICASSGEYTPPVKTYGSSLIRSRNVRPFDSNEQPSLYGEPARRRRHGTPAAVPCTGLRQRTDRIGVTRSLATYRKSGARLDLRAVLGPDVWHSSGDGRPPTPPAGKRR